MGVYPYHRAGVKMYIFVYLHTNKGRNYSIYIIKSSEPPSLISKIKIDYISLGF